MATETHTVIRTTEQQRADYAWQCVAEINGSSKESDKKEYRTLALKLSTMILTNGLGQTLAFLKSKGKGKPEEIHEKAYLHLQNWLKGRIPWKDPSQGQLIEWVMRSSSQVYRHATVEALAIVNWIKRFADATLPKGGD